MSVLALLLSSAAAASEAPPPHYLREGLLLTIAAPIATTPRDDVAAWIGAGQRVVLAEFVSGPVEEPLDAGAAFARLHIASGRIGMEGCAEVVVEVARRLPLGERVVVGTGALATSILPQRETVDPIEVVIPLEPPLAEVGDRLAVTVAVGNGCDDARRPVLLYDALGMASAITFSEPPPRPTTTTTSTTTIPATTSLPAPPAPTTTLPRPEDCMFLPLDGFESVWCRLDTLGATLGDELPEDVGGVVAVGRMQRRLARTRSLLAAAQTGDRVARRLRQALRQLAAVSRLVERGRRRGRVDPDVAGELLEVTASAAGEIRRLR